MKHAMKEYPLYGASLADGYPIFPGETVIDFRGESARYLGVAEGPEYTGRATIVVAREDRHGDGYTVNVSQVTFGLVIDVMCPVCGVHLAEPLVLGDCPEITCPWRHPEAS